MKTVNKLYKLPAKSLFLHYIQPSYGIIFTIFFIFYFIPEWWPIPIIVICGTIISRSIRFTRTVYSLSNNILLFRTRIFDVHLQEVNMQTITTLTIHQTFLQRKLHVASVFIEVADSTVKIQHIPYAHAIKIQQQVKKENNNVKN